MNNTNTKWLAGDLTREQRALLAEVAKELRWNIDAAQAFAVALLEDVNAHPEAKAVNEALCQMTNEN